MHTITTFDNTAEGWERSLYAFLAEKERRSGSRRTVEGYSRMLQHFFGAVDNRRIASSARVDRVHARAPRAAIRRRRRAPRAAPARGSSMG